MMQEFVQQIKDSMKSTTENMHTALPGKIVSFDTGTGLATVLPTQMYKKPDGTTMAFPQVTGVPVVFPQVMNQQATIAYPVTAGDSCLIIVAEQSLDYWLYEQETDTDLAFDLSNSICIPGMFNKANSVMTDAVNNSAVIVDVSGTRLTVKADSIKADVSGTSITVQSGLVQVDAASIALNGNVTVSGTVTASGDVKGSGKSLASHTHTDSEGGTTSSPN